MPSDYAAIKNDNELRYGTDIGRIGPMLLANRYDDRTHFIFELLQNAEDALARRLKWQGSRAVNFKLTSTELRITHRGKPFDEQDVRGICGIAESTKDRTTIGRFGIGFKSVYAFTDRPEIHSGSEDFTVENYVWPYIIPRADRALEETIIVLPLKAEDSAAHEEIANSLQRLGPGTLLFLHQIEEISWTVEGGPSGLYSRSKPKALSSNANHITVVGQEEGKPDVEKSWMVFSREAKTDTGVVAGQVEVAFQLEEDKESGKQSIQPVKDSPLVVFFPTVLPTHLGFLVQGPYCTTPSRDNVPKKDTWNQHLVRETAKLLIEALTSLRDLDYLDTGVLLSLPLDRAKFGEGQMFAPLFDAVRNALFTESLLPRFGEGHTSAKSAKLARTQELRELLNSSQLGTLFGDGNEAYWLSEDITQDRTPELRQYLMRELSVSEITPETILPKLDMAFLQSQSDEWILNLYEFLHGQQALLQHGRLKDVLLIRLEDGRQVPPRRDGQPQAFLPGPNTTGFPTVRRAVCNTESARKLLSVLGLTAPDPVDDVVRNVLPKYLGGDVDVDDDVYEADINLILTAFKTNLISQRDKLIAALRESAFVMAVDAGNGSKWVSKPGQVYIATQRFKNLFEGVSGVFLVDDSYPCLRGEDVRELLEACGATRYLQPISFINPSRFSWQELSEMRKRSGAENSTAEDTVEDFKLRGLDALLVTLKGLDSEQQAIKAALLWEALGDVESRRGANVFQGTYKWRYFNSRSCVFDAAFVKHLIKTAWVPDTNGVLQQPSFVVFESLGWQPNPFLQSKISFRPQIIDTLAKEAGIEPGVLDLLKKLGVTSEAELKTRLGIKEEPQQQEDKRDPEKIGEVLTKHLSGISEPSLQALEPREPEPMRQLGGSKVDGKSQDDGRSRDASDSQGDNKRQGDRRTQSDDKIKSGVYGRDNFGIFVRPKAHDTGDGTGTDSELRDDENGRAAACQYEAFKGRNAKHMLSGQSGFDVVSEDPKTGGVRRIEVKGVSGDWDGKVPSVLLTHRQFEDGLNRKDGIEYWLYVVDRLETNRPRVFPIPWTRKRKILKYGFYANIWRPAAEEGAEIVDGKLMEIGIYASTHLDSGDDYDLEEILDK